MDLRPLALACILAGCTPADPLGSAGALVELSHRVTLRSFDGSARLEVSRAFRNDTDDPLSLSRKVLVPRGAIVTSLRLARGTEAPLRAPLSTEEQVSAKWAALTGEGDAEPTPIGKLEWTFDDELFLELFGLLPHETVTISYDVSVEPSYASGVLSFTYPRPVDEDAVTPTFEHADVDETEEGFVLHRQHFTDAVADVRWATSQIDTDRVLWRLELDVAPELAPRPVAPAVVFVLDASHSQGPEGIARQLELLTPYLSNTPDARVEVVVTRRFAERLFGSFVPVKEIAERLEGAAKQLEPGNGSNLDEGAALAARALAGVGGPARIVLFSDHQLRTSFSTEVTRAALAVAPPDTVVHLVNRAAGTRGLELLRDDDDALDALVEPSGGLVLRVVGAVDGEAATTLANLVRPTRLDAAKVEAPGLELGSVDTLEQGEALRLHGVGAAPPAFVTVSGKLWRREFRKVVGVDERLAQRLPAMAVGEPELRLELSDDELRSVAFLSQAVSPVTSFLAAPPAAVAPRPGTVIGRIDVWTAGGGGWGFGSSSTSCRLSGRGHAVDLESELARLLEPGRVACEARFGEKATAQVRVEVIGDEVVDVEVLRDTVAMSACLTEAAWAIRLGSSFVGTRRSLRVEFRGEPDRATQ